VPCGQNPLSFLPYELNMKSCLRSLPWRIAFPIGLRTALFALLLGVFPSSAQDVLVEGQDYTVIDPAQTWQPDDGRIEVIEVFAYTCSHCAHQWPQIERWANQLPADVRFGLVPISIGRDDGRNGMRAFFAAEALGLVERTHAATFTAFHDTHQLPLSNPSLDEFVGFYTSLGLDADALRASMRADETERQITRALSFVRHAGVRSTPNIIVNGRYLVHGQDMAQVLANASTLIERERAATGVP